MEPRAFVLGKRRIWVARVLECEADHANRRFMVETTDHRRFALRHDLASGEWQLAAARPARS